MEISNGTLHAFAVIQGRQDQLENLRLLEEIFVLYECEFAGKKIKELYAQQVCGCCGVRIPDQIVIFFLNFLDGGKPEDPVENH